MGGFLKIHVQRGRNLAVRDIITSDPYVVIKMGKQVINLASFFRHLGLLGSSLF